MWGCRGLPDTSSRTSVGEGETQRPGGRKDSYECPVQQQAFDPEEFGTSPSLEGPDVRGPTET